MKAFGLINKRFVALTVQILLRIKFCIGFALRTRGAQRCAIEMQGACFRESLTAPPPVEISSSNDSSWQALKVCRRNPFPETYYYLVIAPKGYINSSTSLYDETDVTIIRYRQFPVDEDLAVSHESYTSPLP